jgi:hypothetical protein
VRGPLIASSPLMSSRAPRAGRQVLVPQPGPGACRTGRQAGLLARPGPKAAKTRIVHLEERGEGL